MRVVSTDVPHLGNRTHLVHDGRVGIVIDPPRDTSPLEAAAERAGVAIVAVAETHVHDDYVSGGLRLSKRHGATYLVAADEEVDFAHVGVHDNETFAFGDVELRAIATPGHTRLHVSYLATDPTAAGSPGALFSGGSLLDGSVGRTDLVDPALTTALTRAQWLTARRLGALPPETTLHPTHGHDVSGPGAPAGGHDAPTIGEQRVTNPALTLTLGAFVTTQLRHQRPATGHHAHITARNRAGAWDARPGRRISLTDVHAALARGADVIDVRSASAYATGHLAGTVSVPAGPECAVHAGWVTPWGAEMVLVSDSEDDLDRSVRELASIGIENVSTAVLDASDRRRSLRRTDWAGFTTTPPPAGSVLVDVRSREEWCSGHLPGSRNIPLHELLLRLEEIPLGEVWVHCEGGYRAAVAAGILDRAGHEVVLVEDDFARVHELGLGLQSGRPAA